MRTPAECEAELRSIRDAMHRLSRFDSLSNVQQRDWDRLSATFESVDAERMDAVNDGVRSRMRAGLRDGSIASERGAPVEVDPNEHERRRSTGLRAVDAAGHCEDHVRHSAANLIDRARPAEQERMARYVSATITQDYERAVAKLFNDPMNGHREFSADELRAFQLAQSEKRAMNLGDGPSGGFLVPYALDPTVIISGPGALNPIRALARNVTTIVQSWNGISSAGVTAEFLPEAGEINDGSPILAKPSIPVHRASAFVQASYEIAMDSALASQIGTLMTDAKDLLEADKFTTGSGVGEPRGLITALIAAGGSSVLTSASAALTVADVIANQASLSPRWRPRAQWAANLNIINAGRQIPMGSGTAGGVLDPLIDDDSDGAMMNASDLNIRNRPMMFGWPVNELSHMSGTIRPGVTHDYSLLSGDFSSFVVVDRVGMNTAYIPVLFGASGRPSGEMGWFSWWRTGSDVVVPDAFRLTDFSG